MSDLKDKIKLFGRTILVIKPEMPKSVLELPESAKQEFEMQFVEKFKKLRVILTSDDCTRITAGADVFIPTSAIVQSDIIEVDKKLYYITSEGNVLFEYLK